MRKIRPSGSEEGLTDNGHPYPYRDQYNSSLEAKDSTAEQ
jgi:hypothetical protein